MRVASLGLVVVAFAAPAAVAAQVSGVVQDAETSAPIAGARVQVQASDIETTTAADGTFTLDARPGDAVVTAAAVGYYYGWEIAVAPETGLKIDLDAVPAIDDPSYEFAPPGTCNACHAGQVGQWTGSPMAHAGDNAWVFDSYDGSGTPGGGGGFVYTRDSVHAAADPASQCRSCHQPVAWMRDPGSALDVEPATEVADGVSCDLCHRIASVDIALADWPGMHPDVVRMTRTPDDPVMYGVLGDVDYVFEGRMRPAYNPQLTAEVCALCHQDDNDPDGDGDYGDPDGVPSQETYREWAESEYADPASERYSTCATCHMPAVEANDGCGVLSSPLRRPLGDVRSHRFEGTSPGFLEAALTLTLDATLDDDGVSVVVTIDNDQAGHHVPTGVAIRNVILLVEATQGGAPLVATGEQVVHALGGEGDPAEGYYAGLPGKLYAKAHEGAGGVSPVFFTEATAVAFDTRIPALGRDETAYAFALPDTGGDIVVRARLIYRRAYRAMIDEKGWTEDGHGDPLADLAAPYFGHLMEEAEVVLPFEVEARDAGRPLDAGRPDAGAGLDAGASPDAGRTKPSGGGCGCRASGGGESSAPLLLALVARLRRRGRTRLA